MKRRTVRVGYWLAIFAGVVACVGAAGAGAEGSLRNRRSSL